MKTFDNTPSPAEPHKISFLKPLIAISGFSYLRTGALHISLRTHKTQPSGWKKTNKRTNTDLSQLEAQERGRLCNTLCSSPCICRLSRACILRQTSTNPWNVDSSLDCLLPLPPSADRVLPWTTISSRLISSDFLSQLSSLCPLPDLSSLHLFVSLEISLYGPLCGFRAKTEKEILWSAPETAFFLLSFAFPTKWSRHCLFASYKFWKVVHYNVPTSMMIWW